MRTNNDRSSPAAVLVIVLAAAVCWPAHGHAQNRGAVAAQIRQTHTLVLEDLDLGDYAAARAQLEKAIADAEAVGLADELVNAKSHAMLAGIYVIGFRDEEKAIEHFKKTLAIAPGYELEPPLDGDRVQEVLAMADAILNPVVTCDSLRGIDHKQVVRGQEGEPLTVVFKAGPKLRAGTAHIHYRSADQAGFQETGMTKTGTCDYQGQIPGEAVTPGIMYYFVSMKKDDGRFIAMRGNQKSPYPVQIMRTAPAASELEAENQSDDPDELFGNKQKGGGCATCGTGPSDASGLASWLSLVLLCVLALRRSRASTDAT